MSGNSVGDESMNPNHQDLPPNETTGGTAGSRDRGLPHEQVMGAQVAGAKTSQLLNGTYGTMGPMSMDSELRPPSAGEARSSRR